MIRAASRGLLVGAACVALGILATRASCSLRGGGWTCILQEVR